MMILVPSPLVRQCLALLRSKNATPLSPTTTAQLHALLLTSGHLHDSSIYPLFMLHCASGRPSDAHNLLAQMPHPPPVSLTNSLLRSYTGLGHHREAVALYSRMRAFDHLTFPLAAKACAGLRLGRHGRAVHCRSLAAGFGRDAYVQNALISMYMSCGDVDDAEAVFGAMKNRSVVSWNAVIAGCVKNGCAERALEVFGEMVADGAGVDRATVVSVLPACARAKNLSIGRAVHRLVEERGLGDYAAVKNALIDMYGKCAGLEEARRVFDGHKYDKNVVSWTVMIGARSEQEKKAVGLFKRMIGESVRPDSATLASILPAYAESADLRQARNIHCFLLTLGFLRSTAITTGLVDVYAKAGDLDIAWTLFDRLPEKDVIAWTAILTGYGMHGHAQTAILLYDRMMELGVKPNTVTFTSLLYACSHAGLIDEGLQLFEDMRNIHGVVPNVEHYLSLVDMVGRAGRIKEAYCLIKDMPFEPSSSVWGALLGACVLHKNVEFGEIAAKHLFELEPENTGSRVLLGNIYAAADRWNDVQEVRKIMERKGLIKESGSSLVETRSEQCRTAIL
ncbi:hypothetical protein ZWY2020_021470 [Hordeum vulgare]|nr:hypothetical protein ZWY2020_021470 [Hordeum vulgare]